MNDNILKNVTKLFSEKRNIIFIPHSIPDADALGSCLALYHFFNSKTGKLIDIPYKKIKINKLPKPPKGTKIDNIEITINLNTKN